MHAARTIRVLTKLIPVALSLRRDRRRWARSDGENPESYTKNARRALEAFVSLGPVYIKLGQWLSSRADILPQPYMNYLARLQDDVPAAPFENIKSIIEKELGPVGEAFEHIEENALSCASLGQVHRARLKGNEVVIKVRRPGIEAVVNRDIAILERFLPMGLAFIDPNLRFSARAVLAQFIESIREEMNYTLEADNLRTIRDNVGDEAVIPSLYPERSTARVLTMEYIPGIKVTDVEALDAAGIDRERLIADIHRIFFTMLLCHPVFHADPHPGNISVGPGGEIILYDFGMVGRLDGQTRIRLVRLYLALLEKDPGRTVNAMDEVGMLAPGYNRDAMKAAMAISIDAVHGRRPQESEVRGVMELINRTMNRFPFLLPKHLSLYMRMASILEGIYKTHDIRFSFMPVLREILEREDLARDGHAAELENTIRRLLDSLDTALSLGPEIRRFLNRPPPNNTLLAGSVLASSLFLGSTLLFLDGRPEWGAGMVLSVVVMALAARRLRKVGN